jgi:hypothetical protein
MYADTDTCSPTKAPGSIPILSQGSTWTDDFFGGTNKVIISAATSGFRSLSCDTTVSCINADGSLVLTGASTGDTFASDTHNGGDIWQHIPIGDGSVLAAWDAFDPKTYYFTLGLTLHKVTLVTPPSTVTNTVIYTYPGTASLITTGSGAARSKDNWFVMFTLGPGGSWNTSNDKKIILINLSNPASVFTLAVGSLTMADFLPRAIQISVGINTPDNNRYIFFTGGGSFSFTATDTVFTFNGSTISFNYFLPQNPDAQRLPHPSFGLACDTFAEQQGPSNSNTNCFLAPHAVMAEANGIQYYVSDAGIQAPFFNGALIFRLDKGLLLATSAEAGGGAYMPNYITSTGDLHINSAALGPYVLVSEDASSTLTAYSITGLTIGANPTVTSSPAYAGANGDLVAFAGLTGVGGMTTCTVAALSGATFTAQGCTSTGSYAAATGAFTKTVAPTPTPHMDEIDLIDITNLGTGQLAVKRVASSRDHSFNGGHQLNVYFGGNHANISPDGSLACWQYNNNLPDNVGVACAPTGISPASCSITSPAASQIISGTAFTITSACSGLPNLYSIEYVIDSESQGFSYMHGFGLTWNTNNISNGSSHSIQAVARDALNNVLVTTAAVSFAISSTQNYSDGSGTFNAALATTPSCVSACSGVVNFALAVTGSWSHSKAWTWTIAVDGAVALSDVGQSPSNPNATEPLDTRAFFDGSHVVAITGTQGTSEFVVQYQRAITFSNGGSVPVALLSSAHEVFLTPAGTATLTATLYNADSSTVSSPTLRFYSQNPSIATANQTTGLVTAVGSAPASVQIGTMASVTTGTFTLGSSTIALNAAFTQAMKGNILQVTSGTGCNTGFFRIVNASAGAVVVDSALVTSGTSCGFATGPSRFTWVFINSANTVPHFGKNGALRTSYSPTSSALQTSMFQNFTSTPGLQYPTYWSDFVKNGWNTMEIAGADCLPGSVFSGGGCQTDTSQAHWQTDITNYVASSAATAVANGSYIHLINDAWWRGDNDIFATTQGLGSTFSTPAVQYLNQSWGGRNVCTPSATQQCYGAVIGGTQYDEVNSTYGVLPLATNPFVFGTSGFTQIVATSAVCVGTWTNWTLNGGNNFVIHGATTTALNSVSPVVYHVTSSTTNTFTFSCPGVSNGTYNSGTDASLVLERFAFQWHSSAYVTNNSFSVIMGWANAASPTRPPFSWTTAAATNNEADQNWMGDSNMSSYGELYFTTGQQLISPNHFGAYSLISAAGDLFRARLPNLQDQKPWLALTEGITVNYAFIGNTVSVASISGDIVTTSVPHGIGSVTPGVARVSIAGTSNGAYNATFLIRAAPDATHFQIYGTPSALSAGPGTMTFANGDAYTFSDIQNISPPIWDTNQNPPSGCVIPRHRGQNFTISGTGTAWDGTNDYYPPNNNTDPMCTTSLSGVFYSVPSGSATGGTATIVTDNYYIRGRNVSAASLGPQYAYASELYPYILGSAGVRTYSAGLDQQGPAPPLTSTVLGAYNPTTGAYSSQAIQNNSKINNFTDYVNGNYIQMGPLAVVNIGGSSDVWYGESTANLLAKMSTPLLLQPRLSSPDYGQGFEATARTGSTGNMLVIQSFWNAPKTLTVDLTAVTTSLGGTKYVCNFVGCSATAVTGSSDVASLDAVGTVWYLFPTSGPVNPVTISLNPSSVPGALNTAVQYAYTPYAFQQQSGLVPTASCVSGVCSIPIDRTIGTVYYRPLYIDINGRVVAVGDVQTL